MDEASKPLMAFNGGLLGFCECNHMLFGLLNTPATFQRLVETCLGDLQLSWYLIYLNDIMMFSKTPKDHLVMLRTVFQKLKEVGLILKPSKCEGFRKSLTYLGHIVSEKGIKTDDSKVKVICERPSPKMVTKVKHF